MQEFHGIERVAYLDELTGLGNLSGLKHAYGKKKLNNFHFIFIDIDDFKILPKRNYLVINIDLHQA